MSATMKLVHRSSKCLGKHGITRIFQRFYASQTKKTSTDYCIDIVRRSDYEGFLCTLLLPEHGRTSAMAIRAFNVEIAQVQDTVTNKQIGLMRLQFWKDSLDQLYKEAAPKQPVAMELGRAIHSKNLSRRWLTKLIEARERSLEEKAPMTVKAVEEYADCTSSAVMFLVLESVGIRDVHADHAASHLGKALGLTTLLRATPHHASLRKLNLPVEVLAKHKVSEEQVYRGSQEQEMKDAVFELASLAHQHLDKARSLSSSLPRPALSVFLPALVCDNYLTGLQRAHFNVFDAKLQQKAHLLPAKLWWKKLRGTY